jgi:hypothetical protein
MPSTVARAETLSILSLVVFLVAGMIVPDEDFWSSPWIIIPLALAAIGLITAVAARLARKPDASGSSDTKGS